MRLDPADKPRDDGVFLFITYFLRAQDTPLLFRCLFSCSIHSAVISLFVRVLNPFRRHPAVFSQGALGSRGQAAGRRCIFIYYLFLACLRHSAVIRCLFSCSIHSAVISLFVRVLNPFRRHPAVFSQGALGSRGQAAGRRCIFIYYLFLACLRHSAVISLFVRVLNPFRRDPAVFSQGALGSRGQAAGRRCIFIYYLFLACSRHSAVISLFLCSCTIHSAVIPRLVRGIQSRCAWIPRTSRGTTVYFYLLLISCVLKTLRCYFAVFVLVHNPLRCHPAASSRDSVKVRLDPADKPRDDGVFLLITCVLKTLRCYFTVCVRTQDTPLLFLCLCAYSIHSAVILLFLCSPKPLHRRPAACPRDPSQGALESCG